MKTKALKNRLSQFLGTEKGLLAMSAIVVFYAFVYQIVAKSFIFSDTESYFNAYENYINGDIDAYRTPIYPLFIGIIRTITSESLCYTFIILIQAIIFLISVHYFCRLTAIIKNKNIAYWLTFTYGVIPIVPTWSTIILTESLSISMTIFYIYYTIFSVKNRQIGKVWLSTLWALLLVMLRPSFIYLLPLNVFLFFVGNWKEPKSRHIIYNGILGSIIIIILICGYSYQIKRNYGVFTPSAISIINKYCICKANSSFKLRTINNQNIEKYPTLYHDLKNVNNNFEEASLIIEKFGVDGLKNIIAENNLSKLSNIKALLKRIDSSSNYKHGIVTDIVPFTIIEPFSPNLGVYYFLLLTCAIYTLIFIYKRRKLPWTILMLLLFAIGNIAVSVIGAPGDFGRLQLPSFPAELLLGGMIIQMIKDKSFLKNEFES